MTAEVIYAPAAVHDLDRIWSDVLAASKEAYVAEKYINDLMDTIERKKDYPRSGTPLYYEGSFTGYYSVGFKAYRAFYRIREKTVYVDRILYGKSDYMYTLFGG